MTIIYYTYFDQQWSHADYQQAVGFLPHAEKIKNARFIRWQDRQLGVLGKLLLLQALKQTGIYKSLEQLSIAENGKPYFSDGPYFNISHSGNYAACILSTSSEVGIDVEEVKEIILEDFKSIFTLNEWKQIESSRHQTSVFYELWTKKEAILKADGRGLSISLS